MGAADICVNELGEVRISSMLAFWGIFHGENILGNPCGCRPGECPVCDMVGEIFWEGNFSHRLIFHWGTSGGLCLTNVQGKFYDYIVHKVWVNKKEMSVFFYTFAK